MALTGSSTAEIDAPLAEVWAVVEHVEIAPEWQGGMDGLVALERDGEQRATKCEATVDLKIKQAKSVIRFDYAGAPTKLTWRQEKGDLKSVQGSWMLEDLGGDRTRVTYEIEVDLGRVLGMMAKGPIVDTVRHLLAGARAGELKAKVEGAAH